MFGCNRKLFKYAAVLLLLIFVLSSPHYGVMGKKTSGTVTLNGVNTEKTLTKFSLSPYARGKFSLVIKTEKNTTRRGI